MKILEELRRVETGSQHIHRLLQVTKETELKSGLEGLQDSVPTLKGLRLYLQHP